MIKVSADTFISQNKNGVHFLNARPFYFARNLILVMFQNTFDLALLLTLLDRLALVVFMLPLSQAQQYFGIAMLDIHFQRNQRNPLGRQLTGNFLISFYATAACDCATDHD